MNIYKINLVSGKNKTIRTSKTLADVYTLIKESGMLYIENEKIFMATNIESIENMTV